MSKCELVTNDSNAVLVNLGQVELEFLPFEGEVVRWGTASGPAGPFVVEGIQHRIDRDGVVPVIFLRRANDQYAQMLRAAEAQHE